MSASNPSNSPQPLGAVALGNVLVDLAGSLIGARDPIEAARFVALAADQLIGWDACFVAIYREREQCSTLLYMADIMDGERRELTEGFGRIWPASPVFLYALKSGPIILDRESIAQLGQTYISFGDTQRHTESLMYVPIRDRDQNHIGMISLQSYRHNAYTPEQLSPVRLLAELVAHSLVRFSLEESLNAQDSVMDLMLNEMPAILWTTDRELKFTSSNGAGLRELGLQPNQIVGMSVSEYLASVGATFGLRYHERSLAGETVTYDFSVIGRSYHVTSRPLRNKAGEIIGTVGVATDGTELQKAEQARRDLEVRMLQTQKLESLGVLAGGISHDFNNLLVGVLGNAGLALEELPDGHPAREPVEMILQTGTRMRDLTRQLLAYSGRGRFLNRALNLNMVVRETQELLSSCVSKKAELEIRLAADTLPMRGDQTQIRQLLVNLATNASESLEDRVGRVTITTRRDRLKPSDLPTMMELPPATEGEFVVLEVEDNGCGIREEDLSHVMDPFFTTKAQGRGLGMAAVQGIIRSHGGGLSINSVARLGTRVSVFFPLNDLEATTEQRAAQPQRGMILIAEDEPVVRRFIVDVLQREGLQVIATENGEAAFAAFKDRIQDVSLVILDIVMPRQSGPDSYLQMVRLRPNLPALFVSGASDEDLTRRGLKVTQKNFLPKPFTREALVNKVKAFL